jgi:hypothetical protein
MQNRFKFQESEVSQVLGAGFSQGQHRLKLIPMHQHVFMQVSWGIDSYHHVAPFVNVAD